MLFLFFAAIQGGGTDIPPPGLIPGGNGGPSPARPPRSSDTLPKITRRGVPAAYTRRAAQIERNNEIATKIAKAVAAALTEGE